MHKAIAMPHGAMIAPQYRNEDENANADRDADRDTNATTAFPSLDPFVESIDRRLARLRFQNETEADDCGESADDAIYQPVSRTETIGFIARQHCAPESTVLAI